MTTRAPSPSPSTSILRNRSVMSAVSRSRTEVSVKLSTEPHRFPSNADVPSEFPSSSESVHEEGLASDERGGAELTARGPPGSRPKGVHEEGLEPPRLAAPQPKWGGKITRC